MYQKDGNMRFALTEDQEDHLINEGLMAIVSVSYSFSGRSNTWYGLPMKLKEEPKTNLK